MIVIAVINLKGGSTKTTSAVFLAHALHEAGLSTLGVDADGENESFLHWSTSAEFPFPVIGMPVSNLHKNLPGITEGKYDAVVIDTPPMKEQRGIVLSAARMASHVLCPMAPTPMEYDRLPAVRELLADATDLRQDGQTPLLGVLFTRTVPNAASTGVYRQIITDDGVRVLTPTVGRREMFAQAYGQPVNNAADTAYGDAVNELFSMEGATL